MSKIQGYFFQYTAIDQLLQAMGCNWVKPTQDGPGQQPREKGQARTKLKLGMNL